MVGEVRFGGDVANTQEPMQWADMSVILAPLEPIPN